MDDNKNRKQNAGYDDVDRWPSQRNPQFMARIFWETFQPRDAANGQQCDVSRADVVVFRGQGMPEFVQQHTSKDCDDESDATPSLRPVVTLTKMGKQNPAEQQDERPVQVNADSRERAKFQRPFHERFKTLRRRTIPKNTTTKKSQTKTSSKIRPGEGNPLPSRINVLHVYGCCLFVSRSFRRSNSLAA